MCLTMSFDAQLKVVRQENSGLIHVSTGEVRAGDEYELLPQERELFQLGISAVRQRSGAARRMARELLLQMGYPCRPILKDSGGVPVWPRGVIGSLSHADHFAGAAIASICDFASIGVDVELVGDLPHEIVDVVATEHEKMAIGNDLAAYRSLFSIKEAIYKAAYAADRKFRDFHDVEVNMAGGAATVSGFGTIRFAHKVSHILLSVAALSWDRYWHARPLCLA